MEIAEEKLKMLAEAVREHDFNRDREWDFVDKHGYDSSMWSEEQEEEHNEILDDILCSRKSLQGILREITGDEGYSL